MLVNDNCDAGYEITLDLTRCTDMYDISSTTISLDKS